MPDRREILQDAHTLVVRLTETVVARIVTDPAGPRGGTAWFARETAIAAHLSLQNAPVVPLHPELPQTAFEEQGFAINFWEFVTITDVEPDPAEIGATLFQCHAMLRSFPEPLPPLAILHETHSLLEADTHFTPDILALLRRHLERSIALLAAHPHQPLHGDAHMGNLMMTTRGLLWSDWEDAFSGPVEWDLASVIWNAKLLDHDPLKADAILAAYCEAGGSFDPIALDQSLVARAVVMSAWYPVLYPNPSPERIAKLRWRLDWLREMERGL
jgi:thiamine kinase-like enzyme